MLIENMMYFAMGVLVAGLLALIILPAVWKRAVRLTKRRIEAATPITMAEFRADKDQLRAEFALTTRRLEVNIETLRAKLTESLAEVNQKRADIATLQAERDGHLRQIAELEKQHGELRDRVAQLEREAAEQLEGANQASAENAVALADMPEAADGENGAKNVDGDDLVIAQARIASAESRLNALLSETGSTVEISAGGAEQPLADKLTQEAELESLRNKVANVESSILADWDTDRLEEAAMRDRLKDIAGSVSRLVYAAETETPVHTNEGESLFDRVQRFADTGDFTDVPAKPARSERKGGVSDRMAAIREIQGR
ncbi:hypothetical protein [Devosia submarina]|uniref:hypothetical protein n=1 Tax=Devosia submarina TaxID=1173082 RepID=UPI001300A8EA|nr:hypothetical protein [Devosia submarina]